MKNKREEELEKFRKLLNKIKDDDFDGHTDFKNLSSVQKLEWLSQLVYFKYLADTSQTDTQVS